MGLKIEKLHFFSFAGSLLLFSFFTHSRGVTTWFVTVQALEGPGVVASARKLIGVTNPLNAEPGTIRGDFGIEVGRNVVHGSDSPENGLREIGMRIISKINYNLRVFCFFPPPKSTWPIHKCWF